MRFFEAVTCVFQKYCCFSGRARRSEYWYYVLFNMIVSAILGSIGRAMDSNLLVELWNIAVFLPGLGVCVRRLHDTGKSGWFILWNLVPLVGSIIVLIRLLRDSDFSSNRYGYNPKY